MPAHDGPAQPQSCDERDQEKVDLLRLARESLWSVGDRELVRASPRQTPGVGVAVHAHVGEAGHLSPPRLDAPSGRERLTDREQEWPSRVRDADPELVRRDATVGNGRKPAEGRHAECDERARPLDADPAIQRFRSPSRQAVPRWVVRLLEGLRPTDDPDSAHLGRYEAAPPLQSRAEGPFSKRGSVVPRCHPATPSAGTRGRRPSMAVWPVAAAHSHPLSADAWARATFCDATLEVVMNHDASAS